MTKHTTGADLIEAAIPPVPADLLTPSLSEIHRRHRRRRTAELAVGLVVLAGVIGVATLLAPERYRSAPPIEPVPSVTPPATKRLDVAAYQIISALVSPDGRTLRLATVLDGCPSSARATAVENTGRVLIRLIGRLDKSCLSSDWLRGFTVTLAAPLGDRAVLDLPTGNRAHVLHESDLPRMTWPEATALEFEPDHGESWSAIVNTDTGNRIGLSATPSPAGDQVWGTLVGTMVVDGRRLEIYDEGFPERPAYLVTWLGEGWRFTLTVDVRPGEHAGFALTEKVAGGLRWD